MPKVFISYCSYPEKNKNDANALADRLLSDGIEVIIDIYDLETGADEYLFMEQIVADPTFDRILMLCNKEYTQRANQRIKGVGTEAMIISPEIYQNANQTKFIPLVFEKDENNIPFLPIYLKSKVYLDFSSPNTYNRVYKRLLDTLYGRNSKPLSSVSFFDAKSLKKDFKIGNLELEYLPIISSWNKHVNEYRYGDLTVRQIDSAYTIPDDFSLYFDSLPNEERAIIDNNNYEPKVRLVDYSISNSSSRLLPSEISLTFSKIAYRDFLKTNCFLDERIPNSDELFRDKYFERDGSLVKSKLSNICGVGVFIISSDNKIIVSKTSSQVTVNPDVFAFTASGSMDWRENINPFDDVIRECYEEIGYHIDVENLYLFSFGVEYQLGYYEFAFYEKSIYTADEIIKEAPMARDYGFEVGNLYTMEFDLSIIDHMKRYKWDVTSSAALLTLLAKKFGKSTVEKNIYPNNLDQNYRKNMRETWKMRSQREGKLAVLSNRFPFRSIDQISENYIRAVFDFIDNSDLKGKHVLEVGCGIGLMTKYLANKSKTVTCVDLSPEMINRAKNYLSSEEKRKVSFINCFFQDFDIQGKFDTVICSLVLTHNINDSARSTFIEKLKLSADTIYLFEPTDYSSQPSPESYPVSFNSYLGYFPNYNISKIKNYFLSTDEIIFLKLESY